jgi:hypothetical protein
LSNTQNKNRVNSRIKGVIAVTIALLLIPSISTASNKELLKDGITGFGAGAVGSQIDNPLAAGAAGAGVNIVGGAVLDTLLDSPKETPPVQTKVVEKTIVVPTPSKQWEPYVDREPPRNPGKRWGHKKKQYQDGYKDGYNDALEYIHEIHAICHEALK